MTFVNDRFTFIIGTVNLCHILVVTTVIVFGVNADNIRYEGASCTRHDGGPGTCQSILTCMWSRTNRIPPSQLKRCSFKRNTPIICCADGAPDNVPVQVAPRTEEDYCDRPIFDESIRELCATLDNGRRRSTTKGKKQLDIGKIAQRECLKLLENRPKALTFNILSGELVNPGDYPHMAALGFRSDNHPNREYEFRCGASLIATDWVVTAAHCVLEESPYIVRLGTTDVLNPTDQSSGVVDDIFISEIIKHPLYKRNYQFHDIALIKLVREAAISQFIFPACINTLTNFPNGGFPVRVVGWGETDTSNARKNEAHQYLLSVNLTVVDLSDCDKEYRPLMDRKIKGGLNLGQMCAWDPELKKDACWGDSGGPLHGRLDGIDYIVGIVSFGNGCASRQPSVYSRLSYYVDWIEKTVWKQ